MLRVLRRFASGERSHPHRTRLTNLLWRERYAKGQIITDLPFPHNATTRTNANSEVKVELSNEPKTMAQSYTEIVLPFRQDLELREEYVNMFRGLRLGKILEDLDAFAASIAYRHCLPSKAAGISVEELFPGQLPLTIVTASMDRMDLLNPLRPDLDIKMYGNVTYVGKSSMEVTVRVACLGNPRSQDEIDTSGQPLSESEHNWTPLLLCRFTLVAKDPQTGAPVTVPALKPTNNTEKQSIQLGEAKKQRKLAMMHADLRKQPPTSEERLLIHQLYLEQQQFMSGTGELQRHLLPENMTPTSDTRVQIVKICHPQERNIHSSIFGGFLMREAFELAYTNATLFIRARPYTIAMDDVAFRKPVPIGSSLFLTSEVTYAEGEPHRTFQVSVTAEVIKDINSETREVTNVFHFTFARGDETMTWGHEIAQKSFGRVNKLIPLTYGDTMKYLQGRRRKEAGIKEKKSQLDEFKMYTLDDHFMKH